MSTASLPRPLKPGEFYCHHCDKEVPLAKYTEHRKEHERRARRGLQ